MKSECHEIAVGKEERLKTSSIAMVGIWQFPMMMPQGLTNALAVFQTMVEHVKNDISITEVIGFLDYLIFSETTDDP